MTAKDKNNPGDESLEVVVARIDTRTENMEKDIGEFTGRINNHAGRIRKLELGKAELNGEAKGREFSFKRLAAWIVIIVTVLGGIATLVALTPP